MNSSFIESLESRCLLSSMLDLGDQPALQQAPPALHQTAQSERVRYPNLKGTWLGSRTLTGLNDEISLTLKITRQSGSNFTGRIASSEDSLLRVNVSGKFTAGRKFKITFSGRDSEGPLTGKGSGKVATSNAQLSGRIVVTNASGSYPGSYVFRR